MDFTGFKGFLAVALVVGVYSCSTKDEPNLKNQNGAEKQGNISAAYADQLNTFVTNLPTVKQIEPFAERPYDASKPRAFRADEILPVAGERKDYEQAVALEEQLLFSDNHELFYPGALIKATSVINGDYSPVVAPRKPITISVSLTGSNPTIVVPDPKLSTVRAGVNELLGRGFNPPPANISYSSEEVHDEQHLKIAIGGGYNGTSTSVKATAGFSYSSDKKYFLVKVQQVFYTMDLDTPQKPSDFFAGEFDYKSAFGTNKPLYISSVKVGRILLLGVETSLTKNELDAKLQTSFLGGSFTAEAEANFKSISERSSIRGRVLGGSAKLAGQSVVDVQMIKSFLAEGATWSKDNLGVPIAYKLRELETNQTFKTVIYSRYTREKQPIKRISFDVFFNNDSFHTGLGENIYNAYDVFVRKEYKSGNQEEVKIAFKTFGADPRIYGDIKVSNYEEGEKITFVLKPKGNLEDKGKHLLFEFPEADALIKRAEVKGSRKSDHLYDNNTGEALVLKDKVNQSYTAKFEFENQKVTVF